jgi:ribonuclease D
MITFRSDPHALTLPSVPRPAFTSMLRSGTPLSFDYAATAEAITELQHAIGAAAFVALDTEFERVRTYYSKLCLIQLAVDGRVTCVDALAPVDLGPLWLALADSPATKIIHAGRQDLELIHHESARTLQCPTLPHPIIDTQVAAGLLGIDEQISYAALVENELGERLAKGQTRTDWTRRPLTPEQLDYAADDVRFLVPVWQSLERRLDALGRREWIEADCEALTDTTSYAIDTAEAWRRVKGARRLRAPALARLQRLASWREAQAMSRNKPRQWIVRDDVLLTLADRAPTSVGALRAIRDMPVPVVDRYAGPLLELLSPIDGDAGPGSDNSRPQIPDDSLVKRMLALLREIAEREQLCPSVLATRREVERLVAGRRDVRLMQGWRRGVAGERLVQALEQAGDTV